MPCRWSMFACVVLGLSGCCFLYPDWPDCDDEDPPVSLGCTINIVNHQTICGASEHNNTVTWYVEWLDEDGEVGSTENSELPTGQSVSQIVELALDEDEDGALDDVSVFISGACNGLTFGHIHFLNSIEDDEAITLTIAANGQVTTVHEEQAAPSTSRSGSKPRSGKSSGRASKLPCCW